MKFNDYLYTNINKKIVMDKINDLHLIVKSFFSNIH